MDLIAKRKIFLGLSGLLVFLSLVSVSVFGLKQGIDLKGGTQWQFSVRDNQVNEREIQLLLKEKSGSDISVKRVNDGSFLVKLPDISEEVHQAYVVSLIQKFGEIDEKNFSSIGPAIGSELRKKALWAIIAVLFGVSLYIAWAFRKVSKPIKSWKYGVATLVTLFHDVSIPTGLFALLGYIKGIEIDTNFIVALLVVMGFSVHDTIVVFDRIRENILVNRGKNFSLGEVINKSVKDTMVRSINTSLTLVLVLVALLFFGPPSLFYFVLTILVGTVFGTYSSIFVASPLLYIWERFSVKKGIAP